jgi:hypothetical protein
MSEVIEFDGFLAGNHIKEVCRKAALIAESHKKPVHFEFNDTHITVQPGETAEAVQARWETDMEAAAKAYREHPDRIKEAEERERKDKAEREAIMVDNSATEAQMRESNVPWPKTLKQLNEYIESLAKRNHEYGTCVYSVSMASVATFNYMAGVLGITGFQSGCADFDILRRTRHIKGPFMLIKGEDALYPQYDIPARVEKALEEWKPWLKEEAVKKLAESGSAHPNVVAHWENLASAEVEVETK